MTKGSKFIEALLVILMSSLVSSRSHKNCAEPESFPRITFEQHINTTIEQSYSITPGWYTKMEAEKKVPSEYIDITHKHFFGSRKCRKPKSKNRRKYDQTLNNLSQCMWRYIENIDKNRKPEKILEVDCLCASPLNSKKKSNLVCQNVIEYVSVLRKIGCTNGVYDYQIVWEPRAVACVASALPEPKRLYPIAYKMLE